MSGTSDMTRSSGVAEPCACGRSVVAHLPKPPGWAARSVVEDGGVTHERLSTVSPLVKLRRGEVVQVVPTDVSVSVVDAPVEGEWARSAPTIQVEGESYSVEAAKELCRAISEMLAVLEGTESAS